jgi:transposase
MAIRRGCNGGTCRNSRRCLEHLWFDVMCRGKRFRMAVNEFAVPRMEPGKQRPVGSLEEARDWERLFIGEIDETRGGRGGGAARKLDQYAARKVDHLRGLHSTPLRLHPGHSVVVVQREPAEPASAPPSPVGWMPVIRTAADHEGSSGPRRFRMR